MIDSNVRNLGEVDYDKQNRLKLQKTQVWLKNLKEVYLLLPLFVNRSITKKFPIETLLEMMDYSVKNLGEVEYDKQSRLQHKKNQVPPNNSK